MLEWVENNNTETRKLNEQISMKDLEKKKAAREKEMALLVFKYEKMSDLKSLANEIDSYKPAELDDPDDKKITDEFRTRLKKGTEDVQMVMMAPQLSFEELQAQTDDERGVDTRDACVLYL